MSPVRLHQLNNWLHNITLGNFRWQSHCFNLDCVYGQWMWGVFMPLMVISQRLHYVFGLTVCLSMCDHIRKVYERDILQNARGNFTKFASKVHFPTKMNWLDFEIRRSDVKVTAKPNVFKMTLCEFWRVLVQRSWAQTKHAGRWFTIKKPLVLLPIYHVVAASFNIFYWLWLSPADCRRHIGLELFYRIVYKLVE